MLYRPTLNKRTVIATATGIGAGALSYAMWYTTETGPQEQPSNELAQPTYALPAPLAAVGAIASQAFSEVAKNVATSATNTVNHYMQQPTSQQDVQAQQTTNVKQKTLLNKKALRQQNKQARLEKSTRQPHVHTRSTIPAPEQIAAVNSCVNTEEMIRHQDGETFFIGLSDLETCYTTVTGAPNLNISVLTQEAQSIIVKNTISQMGHALEIIGNPYNYANTNNITLAQINQQLINIGGIGELNLEQWHALAPATQQTTLQQTSAAASSAPPTTEAQTEATAEAQTEATAEAQTEATAEAQTEATAEAQTEATAEAQTEATAEAQTEATAEAQTEATAEAQTEATAEAQTEATAEAQTEATAEAQTEATAEAQTEATAEAQTEATAEAQTEATAEAQTEATAEAQTEATAEAQTEATAEAQTEATAEAQTEATAEAQTEATAEAQTEATAEAQTEATAEAQTEATAEAQTEATAEAQTEATAEAQTEATAEAQTEATAEAQTEATAEAQTKATAEAQTEATAEAQTEATAEAQTEATAEAQTEATAEAQTEATAEAQTKATAEAQTEATAEAQTKATAEAQTEATAEATAEAQTGTLCKVVKDTGWDFLALNAQTNCQQFTVQNQRTLDTLSPEKSLRDQGFTHTPEEADNIVENIKIQGGFADAGIGAFAAATFAAGLHLGGYRARHADGEANASRHIGQIVTNVRAAMRHPIVAITGKATPRIHKQGEHVESVIAHQLQAI